MSVEELGRVADAARDYVYQEQTWRIYNTFSMLKGGPSSSALKIFMRLAKAVVDCYGKRPNGWSDET